MIMTQSSPAPRKTDIEPSSYATFLQSNSPIHQWQPNRKNTATSGKPVRQLFADHPLNAPEHYGSQWFAEIQKVMREEMPVIPIAARPRRRGQPTRELEMYCPAAFCPTRCGTWMNCLLSLRNSRL